MPKRLAAKPKPGGLSRAHLDEKLAELYSVAPRTIRLWRRKGAPFEEPDEMADWIADLRRQGKADGKDIRAARIKKLRLQIEGLEHAVSKAAGQFARSDAVKYHVDHMASVIRENLKTLLLDAQPSLLATKSESDVRAINTTEYHAFCARVHSAFKAHREQAAQEQARQEATPPVSESVQAQALLGTERSRRGRVADPEMEGLRLQKLKLECVVLERENQRGSGELRPRVEVYAAIEEHFGKLRHEIKQLLTTEQVSTLSGRDAAQVLELNRKTYQAFLRRVRVAVEKTTGAAPFALASTQSNPTRDDQT